MGLTENHRGPQKTPKAVSQETPEDKRKASGFLKLSGLPLHLQFCLQFNKQNNLRRSMGFRLSSSSFVLVGREHFLRVFNSIAFLSVYTGDVSLSKISRKRRSNIRHQPDSRANNPTRGLRNTLKIRCYN